VSGLDKLHPSSLIPGRPAGPVQCEANVRKIKTMKEEVCNDSSHFSLNVPDQCEANVRKIKIMKEEVCNDSSHA
jgi:hypothetical protein